MKRYKIQALDPRFGRRAAQESDMAKILGRQGGHWPDAGMPAQEVMGIEVPKPGEINIAAVPIKVWVNPVTRPAEARGKSSKHRVMCNCPGCGKEFSVGRLAQHVCRAGE